MSIRINESRPELPATPKQRMRLDVLNDKARNKNESASIFIDGCLDKAVDCGLDVNEMIDALHSLIGMAKASRQDNEREYF